jgi:protein O-mannosyl-transferase
MPDTADFKYPLWLTSFKLQALIIAILAFTLYANTFDHEYALDDTIVIVQNDYVQQGIAGIKDILTKDTYDSYYRYLKTTDQVPGGRYRPLSVISFAIEQQFMGTNTDPADHEKLKRDMHIRHLFNALWYTISVIVLLYFLRYIVFRNNPVMAFIAALLFTIHPLHTEVVANVKSRDEIMSLLFICLTFITAFRYREHGKKWMLAVALLCYFLAFLSKEYAITLVILLPLAFYLFNGDTMKKSLRATLPYAAVVAVYIVIRLLVMPVRGDFADNDIQVNPYAYASKGEEKATIIATSLNYLKLLVYPHPLSSDYSYNQIPYKDFSSPVVWLSLMIHLALIAALAYFLVRKNILSFAIAFYLTNLLLVNNFLFSVGATMGERLVYHSSAGFAIAVAYLLCTGLEKVGHPRFTKPALLVSMLMLVALCGYATINRNADWKNNETLFLHDINVSPNSFLVNANVASILVNRSDNEKDPAKRRADILRAISLFHKVLSMQNNFVLQYMNLGVAFLKLNEPDSVIYNMERIRALYPIHPQLPQMYYYAALDYKDRKQYTQAIYALRTALQLNPSFAEAGAALHSIDSLQQNNTNQTLK